MVVFSASAFLQVVLIYSTRYPVLVQTINTHIGHGTNIRWVIVVLMANGLNRKNLGSVGYFKNEQIQHHHGNVCATMSRNVGRIARHYRVVVVMGGCLANDSPLHPIRSHG